MAVPPAPNQRKVTQSPTILGRPTQGDYTDLRRGPQDPAKPYDEDDDDTPGHSGAISWGYSGRATLRRWQYSGRS